MKQGQIESIVRDMEYQNTMASRQNHILDISSWRKTKPIKPTKLDPCDKSPTGAHYWLITDDNTEQTCKRCLKHVVLKKLHASGQWPKRGPRFLLEKGSSGSWGSTGHISRTEHIDKKLKKC